MNNPKRRALGGYFELELPTKKKSIDILESAHAFQSARAAFYALLKSGKPNRIWMPKYICNSMLSPLLMLDIEVLLYDINPDFSISSEVNLEHHDWLLYVNYFGVCDRQEQALLKRFNPSQLIFDHAQAFFSDPKNCLATIYSPRKFFGVPDGGLLITSLPIKEPKLVDDQSIDRCSHLLKRINTGPESGYEDFKLAEKTFDDPTPKKMSRLTQRLLRALDYHGVKEIRNENFNYLHENLKGINQLEIKLLDINGALCYPLLTHKSTAKALRSWLVGQKVFTAKYWPETLARVTKNSFESQLAEELLPIPCDQRYSTSDMNRMISLIGKAINEKI